MLTFLIFPPRAFPSTQTCSPRSQFQLSPRIAFEQNFSRVRERRGRATSYYITAITSTGDFASSSLRATHIASKKTVNIYSRNPSARQENQSLEYAGVRLMGADQTHTHTSAAFSFLSCNATEIKQRRRRPPHSGRLQFANDAHTTRALSLTHSLPHTHVCNPFPFVYRRAAECGGASGGCESQHTESGRRRNHYPAPQRDNVFLLMGCTRRVHV
jgi:hypothetical protein